MARVMEGGEVLFIGGKDKRGIVFDHLFDKINFPSVEELGKVGDGLGAGFSIFI